MDWAPVLAVGVLFERDPLSSIGPHNGLLGCDGELKLGMDVNWCFWEIFSNETGFVKLTLLDAY